MPGKSKLLQPDDDHHDDAGTNYEMRPNGGGGGGDDVSDDGATAWLLSGSDAADKVRFILAGEGGESISIAQHSIFCQMDLLCHFDSGEMGWKEMTRWLKFEEKVEDGDRWSKPHVPTPSLHSLLEMRRRLAGNGGLVTLDLEVNHGCMQQLGELLATQIGKEFALKPDEVSQLQRALVAPHKHKHRGKGKDKDEKQSNNAELKPGLTSRDKPSASHLSDASYPDGLTPDKLKPYKPNKKFTKKVPKNSEVANILIGQLDFLRDPIVMFVRLAKAANLSDMSEIDLPTRFLFLILVPTRQCSTWELEEMGRAMGTIMVDKVFCEVAYAAANKEDILVGIDEFIDDVTVLPPSIWDPSTRLEPPPKTRSMDKIRHRLDEARFFSGQEDTSHSEGAADDVTLMRTGRLFGGLINDLKRKYGNYWSDIRDGFHIQCVASTFFLFFACITPIVTFGGLMGQATDNYMGTMESIMSGAVSGVIYHAFAGQPLTIVGATGPLLVFESILYMFCSDRGIDFLAFRFWVGFWIAVILMVMNAFDLSALVRYITRFTEESFSVLISVIFIYEAFSKLIDTWYSHPVRIDARNPLLLASKTCFCDAPQFNDSAMVTGDAILPENSWFTTAASAAAANATINATDPRYAFYPYLNNWTQVVIFEDCITFKDHVVVSRDCVSEAECLDHGWQLNGTGCHVPTVTSSVPDVFFFCWILALGTFALAVFLRNFRTSGFFPTFVRQFLCDFAVLISIIVFTLFDALYRLDTPKLMVPSEIKNSRDDRTWLVNPMAINYFWLIPLGIFPAALATILIFLDQQITSVIVNRAEHKLKKGPGYHLDLTVIAALLIICSLLGIPWFVAATVRSLTHVRSLMKESEVRIPGEKPQFVGVREQRITGIMIHVLIGISAFITPVLKNIPMPVLYGVFLYMGFTSLDTQFIQRILLLFKPVKFQPDFVFLRHVRLTRVHIFTLFQIACMAGMWIVKSIKAISIGFPIMVLALCLTRKIIGLFMSQQDLFWLDHLLPEEQRRKKEDEERALEEEARRVNDFKVVPSQGGDDRRARRRPLSEDVIRRGSLSETKKA